MVFVTPDLTEGLIGFGPAMDGDDSNNVTEGALNDGDTGTKSSGEMRANQAKCFKLTHDVGVDPSTLSSLVVRMYWFEQMDGGDVYMYPYSSGDVAVVTANRIGPVVVDTTGVWFEWAADSAFIGDLGDVGTNQLSIRIVGDDAGAIRGRPSEIEIEFFAAAVVSPAAYLKRMEHMAAPNTLLRM